MEGCFERTVRVNTGGSGAAISSARTGTKHFESPYWPGQTNLRSNGLLDSRTSSMTKPVDNQNEDKGDSKFRLRRIIEEEEQVFSQGMSY